ncbi:MAG: ABC transporter permease [Proteobacteria bacterium]|nr:ABC transporter permease [Pseudomonadota bacterium]
MAKLFKIYKLRLFNQALKAIISYPLRSFFCLIGISLGILSITLIIASIEGANKKALQLFSDFGPDAILIFSGSEQLRSARIRINTLTFDDMEAIRNHIIGCYETIPMIPVRNMTVAYGDKKWRTLGIGSTTEYFTSWGWRISDGNSFSEEDIEEFNNVAVIGQEIVKQVFNGDPQSAIGKTILLNNKPFYIAGVLKERGISFGSMVLDDRIIMPITTVMRELLNERKYIGAIRARFYGDLNSRIEDVVSLLRERHGLKGEMPNDFTIRTAEDAKQFLLVLQGTLVLFLGITGSISLVVGGFVMANLFMISVQERSSEIGIRRAFGAKKNHIITQILLECVIIALAGSLIGLILSFIAGKLILAYTTIPISFSYKVFWITALVATIVGVISGLYPAKRAASLNPVEALFA